jgi:hypothetical protein
LKNPKGEVHMHVSDLSIEGPYNSRGGSRKEGRFALEPYKQQSGRFVSEKIESELVKIPTDLSESDNEE